MTGQQLYQAGISISASIVWFDHISLKEYTARNYSVPSNLRRAQFYKTIAKDDFHAITAAIKEYKNTKNI